MALSIHSRVKLFPEAGLDFQNLIGVPDQRLDAVSVELGPGELFVEPTGTPNTGDPTTAAARRVI